MINDNNPKEAATKREPELVCTGKVKQTLETTRDEDGTEKTILRLEVLEDSIKWHGRWATQ